MIQIGLSLTGLRTGISGDGGTPPAGPGYYPDVPAVDLTAATGSLQFPEGNWGLNTPRAGLTTQKGLLKQAKNAALVFPGGTTVLHYFAVVRLPLDKRQGGYSAGIFGTNHLIADTGNKLLLHLFDPEYNTAAARNCFRFFHKGAGSSITVLSPVWDEDAALIVVSHDGAGAWSLDWYSLADGARHAGTTVTQTATTLNNVSSTFNIGAAGNFAEFTANVHPAWASGNPGNDRIHAWEGEIAALGLVNGAAVTPAQWSAIALGARLADVLPVPKVTWVREFNGTGATLARPAWATADATAASEAVGSSTDGVPGSRLVPGSSFRRQSPAQYVLFNQKQSAGIVHGLTKGQSERSVAFSGTSSGPVELRVYEAATGRVLRDWTAMESHAGGMWSGSLMLPESTNGWLYADARLAADPTVIAHGRNEFAVGFKFMIMGQSQTALAMNLSTTRLAIAAPMSASFVNLGSLGTRAALGAAARRPIMGRVGTGVSANGDGIVSFLNQFRAVKPKTPFMVIREAIPGTSMASLLAGEIGASDRSWADLTDKLDHYGRDITAVLFNWGMNESTMPGPMMEDMFLASHLGHTAKSLVNELLPGWAMGVIGGDRGTADSLQDKRLQRIRFAQANGFNIGPMVSDYRINDAGGGHPGIQFTSPAGGAAGEYAPPAVFENGGARFMQRMAVMALQTIGEIADDAVHPHYRNPRRSADGTQIILDVIAVNGGTIYSPAPNALRSWYVREPGDTGYATPAARGATAILNTAVSPPRVEITRASGAWPAGTVIYRMDDSELRPNDDGAAEDAIHAGGIYESWDKDPLGFGFPVIGTTGLDGLWQNILEVTLS